MPIRGHLPENATPSKWGMFAIVIVFIAFIGALLYAAVKMALS
jgi:hypothetical protein